MILPNNPDVNHFVRIMDTSPEDISHSLRLLAKIIAEKHLRSSGNNAINKKESQNKRNTQDSNNDDKSNDGEVGRL